MKIRRLDSSRALELGKKLENIIGLPTYVVEIIRPRTVIKNLQSTCSFQNSKFKIDMANIFKLEIAFYNNFWMT